MFSLFIGNCGASCGQLPVSFCAQGINGVPTGSWGAIRDWPCGNPQLLPAYAQDRCHFAQVIHRLVHRNRVREPVAGLATAPQRCPRHGRHARRRLAAGHRMPLGAGPRRPLARSRWRAWRPFPRSVASCRRGTFVGPAPAGRMTKVTHERHNSRRARAERRADRTLQHGVGPAHRRRVRRRPAGQTSPRRSRPRCAHNDLPGAARAVRFTRRLASRRILARPTSASLPVLTTFGDGVARKQVTVGGQQSWLARRVRVGTIMAVFVPNSGYKRSKTVGTAGFEPATP